ncbi:MAG: hypothetical protein Q8S29_01510 [Phreatobacter sp.]|nr:hypothetical protein [Phreatobacter sp.]
MSLHLSTGPADVQRSDVASPPLAPGDAPLAPRHSELLSRLGIHSWSIDLKSERVRWETVDPNGRVVAITGTLSALLGQAGDADAAKFRTHIKTAIDTGAAGPDIFSFDDRDHANSQIESVCVLRWISGRPILAGLYRDTEREHQQEDQIGHLVANLDAFLMHSPSCTLVLARDGTVLNCNPAFLKFGQVTERRQVVRRNVYDLAELISPKLVSIVRGALASAETLHGHSVVTFRHGQMRDVHWRCFSLEGRTPDAVTRVFAFDLRRPDADDLVE